MKVLVVGYYNKGNLGDDAYQDIMGRFFPGAILEFILSDLISTINPNGYDAVIVGGGDIINDYFMDKIRPFLEKFKHGPKIAFSIGIPFPSLINEKYLGCFDHVFTRNYEDIRSIQRVLGSHRAHFIPDICFAYRANQLHKDVATDMVEKTCGVFLVGNIIKYRSIVEDISHLIAKISLTYNVILYCFNPSEDGKISTTVRNLALKRIRNSYPGFSQDNNRITVNTSRYSAQEIINIMAELD